MNDMQNPVWTVGLRLFISTWEGIRAETDAH